MRLVLATKIGLFGGKVPLVVRSQGENWELVCESYVHGVMQGEAFEPEKCKTTWLA